MSPKTKNLNKKFKPVLPVIHDNKGFKSFANLKQLNISDVSRPSILKLNTMRNKNQTQNLSVTRNLNLKTKRTEIGKRDPTSFSPQITIKSDLGSYQNNAILAQNKLNLPLKSNHITKSGLIRQTVTFKEPEEYEKPSMATRFQSRNMSMSNLVNSLDSK